MKFECGDLDRALRNPELMPEAREHLKSCAACRREYQLWANISSTARELHCDWETPALWNNIKAQLAADSKPRRKWWLDVRVLTLAASLVIVSTVLFVKGHTKVNETKQGTVVEAVVPTNQDFLTDRALQEVEKNEDAYVRSIQKLSRLAEPKLQRPATALSAAYREKLLVLDSAIAETRANVAHNRFNVRLQTELAGLYTEKQQTLREFLTGDSATNDN
ncbi:MAG: hypothetical protein M3Y57_03035 [Acidobacteriota bacterium]|nr:hypothetical protein [Acidobacteriota bacterium]